MHEVKRQKIDTDKKEPEEADISIIHKDEFMCIGKSCVERVGGVVFLGVFFLLTSK